MKNTVLGAFNPRRWLAVFLFAVLPALAMAQVPSIPPPPYNTPTPPGVANTPPVTAVITNTARAPGTTDSNILQTYGGKGVVCTFNQTTESGSPSTVLSVLAYDSASATFVTYVTSGASVANSTVPTSVMIYPGIAITGLPTAMTAANLHMPRFFKVRQVTTGALTTTTGTVGCDVLN